MRFDKLLSDCIYGYNCHRYQWTLEKLTPVEYRNQLLVA
ncbi:IS3 family transposase [Aneurinibacillus aneurinilyticus]